MIFVTLRGKRDGLVSHFISVKEKHVSLQSVYELLRMATKLKETYAKYAPRGTDPTPTTTVTIDQTTDATAAISTTVTVNSATTTTTTVAADPTPATTGTTDATKPTTVTTDPAGANPAANPARGNLAANPAANTASANPAAAAAVCFSTPLYLHRERSYLVRQDVFRCATIEKSAG